MAPTSPNSDTADRILDIAETLVQTRGFNGFSYADIAAELGVTKASLHYHFPSKSKLGERLIERYRTGFQQALEEIAQGTATATARLEAYIGLYSDVLARDRMCLCGMLAADYATLPAPMQAEVRQFFEANETWLSAVLRQGRQANEVAFDGSPLEVARDLTAALEGAMLLGRSQGDPSRLRAASRRLLANFGVRRQSREAAAD